MSNFRKQTQFFKDARLGETNKYEAYFQNLCNQNDGQTWRYYTQPQSIPSWRHFGDFLVDKLTVVTFAGTIHAARIRKFLQKNWNTLTMEMENSSILFIAGIYKDNLGKSK